MRGSELNQEILGEMADEIAGLLRGRSGLLDDTELTTNVGTVATGNGIVVQVLAAILSGMPCCPSVLNGELHAKVFPLNN